ncbi:DNA polymerase III subunit alpha [bacterium]|nr:DNA polymerase III subunit alpha [candidate division CSSED10-310 bacterium]
MNQPEFIHLHNHTMYSLLDGAIRLPDLAARVRQYGMPAVAITDHGNMFGTIDFYLTMTKADIKPIIGCEVYITPGSRRDKNAGRKAAYHLVLLAENELGYTNLVKLVSKAYLEGFYRHPRIDYELLQTYPGGLIALSACLGGEIPSEILNDQPDKARTIAGKYAEIFGEGNFFLEVQRNGLKEQDKVNRELLKISRELAIPLVATNDCHYLDREDKKAHEVLLCIQTGHTIDQDDRLTYESDSLYFRPAEEMVPLFDEFPGACTNTVAIAERCNLTLDLDNPVLPPYQPPEGKSKDEYLDEITWEGLENRLAHLPYQVNESAYRDRLKEELQIIKNMGYSSYFLIVADFIRFAHENGIPVGPGRGSGAGSLVAYALRIIDLDPIPYDLLFERFLNPERVSMPDFDIDFCMNRREEVIRYVTRKYGKDRVGQIITFNCMKAKAVIRDVGRALKIPLAEVDKLAKLVPGNLNMTLAKALKQENKLREMVDKNPAYRELFQIAQKLEGLNRHAGVHAAGVVISDKPLWETVPVKREGKDELVTQFAKDEVEKAGLVKFDFLGLKTLTVIDTASKMINSGRSPDEKQLRINYLPLDDPEVFALISTGETFGVFQMESGGFQEMIRQMKPSCFEDIIAAVALYRPGPMDIIPDFIARKHGQQELSYFHASLEPILKGTYGLIVYQEQVMQISRVMAGFSMGHADLLRRAMGKKKPEEMAQMRDIFIHGSDELGIKGAANNGYDARFAGEIFDLMEKFSGYGFNKSHAAGYAMLSYQTAYLKRYHPREFMCALMSCDRDKTDKVVRAASECVRMNISVLPPDVNSSGLDFTVVEDGIRFGLAAIKNVGMQAVENIIECRQKDGPFTSLLDFCRRVDLRTVNRRVIEGLIKCGAFDRTGWYRSRMMAILDQALEIGARIQRDREIGQVSLFETLSGDLNDGDADIAIPDIAEWNAQEKLAHEKESLGFYVTGHPLMRVRNQLKTFTTHDSTTLKYAVDLDRVVVAGIPSHVKRHMTKTREQMAFLTLEDLSGFVEVIVRPREWQTRREMLERDEILVIQGSPSHNDVQMKVVADEIMTLSDARRKYARGIALRVKQPTDCNRFRQTFTDLIRRYKGNAGIQFIVEFPFNHALESVTLDLSEEYRIDPSDEFLAELKRIESIQTVEYR